MESVVDAPDEEAQRRECWKENAFRVLDLRQLPSVYREMEAMSDQNELYYAHMEADRNEAEAAYFNARPELMRTIQLATLFRAGFERAYAKLWPLARMQIDEPTAQETSPAPTYIRNPCICVERLALQANPDCPIHGMNR
jgi:hypothetical protein